MAGVEGTPSEWGLHVMVIFGWLQRVTVLGTKLDECHNCGHLGEHALVRQTWWAHVFWLPILLLRFRHGMACSVCAAWTGIGFIQMRRATRSGTLPLDRVRSQAARIREEVFDQTYRRPTEAEMFDAVTVNPRRGAFDLYVKVWPILVVVLIAFIALWPRPDVRASAEMEAAHECWENDAGLLTGCRMADGTIVGERAGGRIVCYFHEPLPADGEVMCESRR